VQFVRGADLFHMGERVANLGDVHFLAFAPRRLGRFERVRAALDNRSHLHFEFFSMVRNVGRPPWFSAASCKRAAIASFSSRHIAAPVKPRQASGQYKVRLFPCVFVWRGASQRRRGLHEIVWSGVARVFVLASLFSCRQAIWEELILNASPYIVSYPAMKQKKLGRLSSGLVRIFGGVLRASSGIESGTL
jgi:hypothetical protein